MARYLSTLIDETEPLARSCGCTSADQFHVGFGSVWCDVNRAWPAAALELE